MGVWLDFVTEVTGNALVDTGQLEKIVGDLPHPQSQYPSLIWFAGNENRIKALQALFPHNNITRRGPAGLCRLHISTHTAHSENPILVAESNTFKDTGVGDSKPCHLPGEGTQRHPVSHGQHLNDVRRQLDTNALLAWTHVLCLFVDTPAEFQWAREMVQRPCHSIKVGNRAVSGCLRFVIVQTFDSETECGDKAQSQLKLQYESQQHITILDLRHRFMLSPKACFEPLRQVLLDQIDMARTEKLEKGVLFSASHLSSLWSRTLDSVMSKPGELPMDCLQMAREGHELNCTTEHLVHFIDHARDLKCTSMDVHTFIATALLMNAYPPGMHRFHPRDAFNHLYKEQCYEAWTVCEGYDPEDSCDTLMTQFDSHFGRLSPIRSSANIRKAALNEFFNKWKDLYSTKTCLSCLCCPPEHVLPCHHSICDNCVVIFGLPSKNAEYHYSVPHCPLCGHTAQVVVRQLPPTKRPVLMSLDGGGIRGIIQLGLLKTLEKKLGPAISLTHIIDLWAGTSVGALNEMDLVLNNLSADKCFEKFTEFAKKVFEFEKTPIYGNFKWVRILSGILKDGKYDAEGLEEILKHGLSSYRRIFDFGTTSGISSRICIIASRVSDGKACVLANYRGIGIRPAESAYEFLTPGGGHKDPLLWQAARCSVAAPGFFKTKDLPGFGPLQDGGVRANNPMSIALRESNVIWRSARGHDLLISVGTGFTDPKLVLDNHSSGNPFRDAAVSRLFRATMFSPTMDGEQAFQEALNYVPDNMMGSIFRLNQAVDCPLPRLDELEKLEVLRGMTYNVPDDLASAVLVTGCFFFELDEFPTPQNGSYHCQGSILCRTQHPRSIVSRVIEGFPGGSYQTSRGYNLGLLGEDNGCRECGYYRKKVSFFVKSLEEVISIKIANSAFRRTIGGFPVSMQDILHKQRASARFGRSDHSANTWPPRRPCFCFRGTRRLVQFTEPLSSKKRRRL